MFSVDSLGHSLFDGAVKVKKKDHTVLAPIYRVGKLRHGALSPLRVIVRKAKCSPVSS